MENPSADRKVDPIACGICGLPAGYLQANRSNLSPKVNDDETTNS